MAGQDWTDNENDAAVAAWFRLLEEDLADRPPNKAALYRALAAQVGRSPKSIERKFQNISAVVEAAGETWVRGLAPLRNYQASLEDAVARWLDRNELPEQPAGSSAPRLADPAQLYIAPPPTLSNRPPPKELSLMQRTARRFDAAGRDARNRALGQLGERIVYDREGGTLRQNGRADLADRVVWTARDHGDGAGYDIASFTVEGAPRLIEVKTTNGGEWTPFHITRNELAVSEERGGGWTLVRLWDMRRGVKAFELHPPLSRHVELVPDSYVARFE